MGVNIIFWHIEEKNPNSVNNYRPSSEGQVFGEMESPILQHTV